MHVLLLLLLLFVLDDVPGWFVKALRFFRDEIINALWRLDYFGHVWRQKTPAKKRRKRKILLFGFGSGRSAADPDVLLFTRFHDNRDQNRPRPKSHPSALHLTGTLLESLKQSYSLFNYIYYIVKR